MKNLKIYYISESYINYLRQFDKNVAYNKNTTRPYIGIVYTYNNYNYFIITLHHWLCLNLNTLILIQKQLIYI